MDKVEKIIPKVKAEDEEDEEDLVDPVDGIKEKCADGSCAKFQDALNECNDRVNGKTKTTETCWEEIVDFYHCVDHCAADKIFKVLK